MTSQSCLSRTLAIVCGAVLPMLLPASAALGQLPAPARSFIDWPMPWNARVPGMVSADGLLPKPAGRNGFVVARDGHFFSGADRVRFWGVNTCFAGDFPTKEQADAVAARLAAFGFNAVRFHHMDNQPFPNGIFADRSLEKLSPEALDRLDYFIAALKRHGIYANLNLHVSRWYSRAHNWQDAASLPSYDKVVDLFHPDLIAAQKQYARDLLTHFNPYTKTRYVDEPAVAIVEINNENSLFMWGSEKDIDNLPAPYAAVLQKLWNQWLVARYSTRAALASAWAKGVEPEGPNLLSDSAFATVGQRDSGWYTEIHEGGKMTVSRDGQAVKIVVPAAATPSWHVQFNHRPIALKKGQTYTVRFRARTDKPGAYLSVGCQQAHQPYNSMGLSGGVYPTANWQQFELGFEANADDAQVKFSFGPGQQAATIWLADAQLVSGGQVPLREAEDAGAGSVALCTSGKPWSAPRRLDWYRFLQATDQHYFVDMMQFLKKDLGLKCAVTGTIAYGPLGTLGQSQMDFVDQHAYWEHPHFPHRAWDMNDWTIGNKPMSDNPAGSTLPHLASTRVLNKPYTITEYQHSAPNEWQAECMPMIATFAALQDWDGIFIFAYSHNGQYQRDRITSFFDIEGNPAKMAPSPLAARIFLGRQVKPLARQTVAAMDINAALENPSRYWTNNWGFLADQDGLKWQTLLGSRLAVTFNPANSSDAAAAASPLTWSASGPGSGRYVLGAPGAAVFTGFPGGKPVDMGSVTLQRCQRPFAILMVVPADPAQTIENADRLLVCAMGRAGNTDMQWNTQHTSVGNRWGKAPSQIEPVKATLLLKSSRALRLITLDNSGEPTGRAVDIAASAGSASVELPGDAAWYVIERR